MATQCRRTVPAETDLSGEGTADSKVADMQCRYDNLKSLAVERHGVLSSFVPTVQQYESSQGAWATLLCGWEEKAAMLPPPGAKTNTIREQIEEIKVSTLASGSIHVSCCNSNQTGSHVLLCPDEDWPLAIFHPIFYNGHSKSIYDCIKIVCRAN